MRSRLHTTRLIVIWLLGSLCGLSSVANARGQFSVDVNPLWLITTLAEDDEPYIRTGVSYFLEDSHYEVALPFAFADYAEDSINNNQVTVSIFSADLIVRRYWHKQPKGEGGFYLGPFVRATYLLSYISHYNSTSWELANNNDLKFGAGIDFGVKKITEGGFFWGASISIGQYFSGEHGKYNLPEGSNTFKYNQQEIIDIDLLKFGFVF